MGGAPRKFQSPRFRYIYMSRQGRRFSKQFRNAPRVVAIQMNRLLTNSFDIRGDGSAHVCRYCGLESGANGDSEEWTTTTVSLYDFEQYEMTGYGDAPTGEAMSSDYLTDVIRIDLMNTEFSDGEFELEVDYIEFRGPVTAE